MAADPTGLRRPPGCTPPRRWSEVSRRQQRRARTVTPEGRSTGLLFLCPRSGPCRAFTHSLPGVYPPLAENGGKSFRIIRTWPGDQARGEADDERWMVANARGGRSLAEPVRPGAGRRRPRGRGGPGGERGVAHGQPGPGRGEAHGGSWGPHPDWRPGRVVEALPRGHLRVPYRGGEYFFHDGYWYRPDGPRYVLVVPPRGCASAACRPMRSRSGWAACCTSCRRHLLPVACRHPRVRSGQPAAAGSGTRLSGQRAGRQLRRGGLPARGQGPDQQSRDRYECHRWAVGESGFDPAGRPTRRPPRSPTTTAGPWPPA